MLQFLDIFRNPIDMLRAMPYNMKYIAQLFVEISLNHSFSLEELQMPNITNRELDVLEILLAAGDPMKVSDIINADHSLSLNTVQPVLRGLLRKGLIEVAGFARSGKVMSRCYRPTEASKVKIATDIANKVKILSRNLPSPLLFSALLGGEDSDVLITVLESIIQEKKNAVTGE